MTLDIQFINLKPAQAYNDWTVCIGLAEGFVCVTVQAALYFPPTLMVPQFSPKVGKHCPFSCSPVTKHKHEYPSFCQDPCYTFSFTLPSSALKVWTIIMVCVCRLEESLFSTHMDILVWYMSPYHLCLWAQRNVLCSDSHTFHVQTSLTYR